MMVALSAQKWNTVTTTFDILQESQFAKLIIFDNEA